RLKAGNENAVVALLFAGQHRPDLLAEVGLHWWIEPNGQDDAGNEEAGFDVNILPRPCLPECQAQLAVIASVALLRPVPQEVDIRLVIRGRQRQPGDQLPALPIVINVAGHRLSSSS